MLGRDPAYHRRDSGLHFTRPLLLGFESTVALARWALAALKRQGDNAPPLPRGELRLRQHCVHDCASRCNEILRPSSMRLEEGTEYDPHIGEVGLGVSVAR